MPIRLIWDEPKRLRNLAERGLDFADAALVLDSEIRLDALIVRGGEERIQSFAYVFELLAVLTVVHTVRHDAVGIISFRRASEEEREVYHAWLEDSPGS